LNIPKRCHIKKIIIIIFVFFVLIISSWLLQRKNQFDIKSYIQEKTLKTVLLECCDENEIVFVIHSSSLINKFNAILFETSIAPVSSFYKYKYNGLIIFRGENNSSFQIDIFANNIIRVNHNYYQLSQNLLDIFKSLKEVE